MTAKTTFTKLPRHVAIIMDGNGRWAQSHGKPRIEGHRSGVESIRSTVRSCGEMGIEYLTLYAFSVENWSRPKAEVNALMQLLKFFLKKEVTDLNKNNVRLLTIGATEELPASVQKELEAAKKKTAANTGLKLILALNYGGRREIVDGVNRIVEDVRAHRLNGEKIDEKLFASYLYTDGIPDPDLLIRTSGEMRVSNFLLWQISYAEIFVSPVFWPQFRRAHLEEALRDYERRQRRFGGV